MINIRPYQPFDIPHSIVTNLFASSEEVLNLFNDQLFNLIEDPLYFEPTLIAFDFFSNHSFTDWYILKRIVFPYLMTISKDREKINIFYTWLISSARNKNGFILKLIDSNIIFI